MMLSKKVIVVALVVAVVIFVAYNVGPMKNARVIESLVAKNIEARGGADNWAALDTLRLSGQMDIGQGMHVPYIMEQKRPGKMCIEFEFSGAAATQCVDGDSGWKRLPFRGSNVPEEMTEEELREMAVAADIDGLLFNAVERGYKIALLGEEQLGDRVAVKLQVTTRNGAIRWLYIDKQSGLDIKLEMQRIRAGKGRLVETYYYDWQETDGLLIPRRQETLTEGSNETHFLTVDGVDSNPQLEDSRFEKPAMTRGASS